MLAQSVSLSSWLRMYHADSSATILKYGLWIGWAVKFNRESVCNSSHPFLTISPSRRLGSSQGMYRPRRSRYAPPYVPPYSSKLAYFGDVKRFSIDAEI